MKRAAAPRRKNPDSGAAANQGARICKTCGALNKPDATTYTFGRDGLGSVRAEVTSSGSVSKSFRYSAYGAIAQRTGGAPTSRGFAAELIDPSSPIYLRAGWYDPGVGRFLTRDSFGGDTAVPVTLNLYGANR